MNSMTPAVRRALERERQAKLGKKAAKYSRNIPVAAPAINPDPVFIFATTNEVPKINAGVPEVEKLPELTENYVRKYDNAGEVQKKEDLAVIVQGKGEIAEIVQCDPAVSLFGRTILHPPPLMPHCQIYGLPVSSTSCRAKQEAPGVFCLDCPEAARCG